MTDQEINIAIAGECGWTGIAPCGKCPGGTPNALPPYTTDLNAMHEAEKVLTVEQKEDSYQTHLNDVVSDGKSGLTWGLLTYLSIHATARQRAEAFLRTIGKWKD